MSTMAITVRTITADESEILDHWQRCADVIRYRRARMLRLSGECLEELGRRYPRVAATLHGNLNKTLAAKLALRTRESALDDAFFQVPAIFRPGTGPGADLVLDSSLTERLAGLGIRTETLAALTLIPLVRVAWADEQLDAEERSAVVRGAESVGIAQDSPGHELLREHFQVELQLLVHLLPEVLSGETSPEVRPSVRNGRHEPLSSPVAGGPDTWLLRVGPNRRTELPTAPPHQR